MRVTRDLRRLTSRYPMLVHYVILILALTVMYLALQHTVNAQHRSDAAQRTRDRQQVALSEEHSRQFQMQLTRVCRELDDNHISVNALLDRLALTAHQIPGRTPQETQAAIDAYKGLRLARLDCPPLG